MLKFLIVFLFPTCLFAQVAQDLYVEFPAQTTLLQPDTIKIWIHVPANYPSSGGGALLGLHGLGDPNTSLDIRTYLTATSDSFGLLLICPEPYLGQENATLLSKSKAVINETLDSIQVWNQINTNQIYICGYSAGSDASAHYTLENPKYPIQGFIWFAPGFYGSLLYPNIDTAFVAPIPPICLCRGTTDLVSQTSASKIESIFSNSSVPFLKISPQGIGHTMNYPTVHSDLKTCMNFFQSSSVNVDDLMNLELNIYPNFTDDLLNVETNVFGEKTYEIFDIQGHRIKNNQFSNNIIDVQDLKQGLYFLKISNQKQESVVAKFIKN